MGFVIAIGDSEKCEEYVLNELSSHKIPVNEAIIYSDNIGVKEARALTKLLSFKNPEGQCRAVVIKGKMTIEAQNVLLKSLEDLHDNWVVVLTTVKKDDLLPTILSRGFVHVFAPPEKPSANDSSSLPIYNQSVWQMTESLTEEKNSTVVLDELICKLRNDLLKAVKNNDLTSIKTRASHIKELLELTPLAVNNNVQMRIILEKAFLL